MIVGNSPTQALFARVGDNDPTLTELDLQASAEMMRWPVERQRAAIALLCHNTCVRSINLRSLQLTDGIASTLAMVLSTGRSLEVLNLEQNDLREHGLTAIINALSVNATLREVRLTGQKMPIAKSVRRTGQAGGSTRREIVRAGVQ